MGIEFAVAGFREESGQVFPAEIKATGLGILKG